LPAYFLWKSYFLASAMGKSIVQSEWFSMQG